MEFNKNSGFTPQEITLVKENLNNLNDSVEQIESEISRIPQPFFKVAEFTTQGESTLNFDELGEYTEFVIIGNIKAVDANTNLHVDLYNGDTFNKQCVVRDALQNNDRLQSFHLVLMGDSGLHIEQTNTSLVTVQSLAGGSILHLPEVTKITKISIYADVMTSGTNFKLYARKGV